MLEPLSLPHMPRSSYCSLFNIHIKELVCIKEFEMRTQTSECDEWLLSNLEVRSKFSVLPEHKLLFELQNIQ